MRHRRCLLYEAFVYSLTVARLFLETTLVMAHTDFNSPVAQRAAYCQQDKLVSIGSPTPDLSSSANLWFCHYSIFLLLWQTTWQNNQRKGGFILAHRLSASWGGSHGGARKLCIQRQEEGKDEHRCSDLHTGATTQTFTHKVNTCNKNVKRSQAVVALCVFVSQASTLKLLWSYSNPFCTNQYSQGNGALQKIMLPPKMKNREQVLLDRLN